MRAAGPDYGYGNARYLAAAANLMMDVLDVLDALDAAESERDVLRAELAARAGGAR